MSEMQRNRGIVKRLSTSETKQVVFDKLRSDGELDNCDVDLNDDGTLGYFYDNNEKYDIINDSIFDVSGAPDESVDDAGEVNEAERLNETDYRVHAYYYNGGADLGEMLSHSIPLADKAYEKTSEFFAVKRKGGGFITGAGNSYLQTPRLYFSEKNARRAVEQHWPGVVDRGYEIVRFIESK